MMISRSVLVYPIRFHKGLLTTTITAAAVRSHGRLFTSTTPQQTETQHHVTTVDSPLTSQPSTVEDIQSDNLETESQRQERKGSSMEDTGSLIGEFGNVHKGV